MNPMISTTSYEFAHGKTPRGYGHWAFFFNGNVKIESVWWFTGKWADAKRAAIDEAKRRRAAWIAVGS